MKNNQASISRSGAKWLPGAMALAATGSTQAATVQITLTGNMLSSSYGNELNADLTGDGGADLTFGYPVFAGQYGAFVQIAGAGMAYANQRSLGGGFRAKASFTAGGVGVATAGSLYQIGYPVASATYLNPVLFSDPRINAGSPTAGWLEVHAFNSGIYDHAIEFSRLIFDDASTTRPTFSSIPGTQTEWSAAAVPEPSSFALLTLGAAGLIKRRRRVISA